MDAARTDYRFIVPPPRASAWSALRGQPAARLQSLGFVLAVAVFLANVVLTPHSPVPWPLVAAAPFVWILGSQRGLDTAVSAVFRPAVMGLIAFGLIQAVGLGDPSRIAYAGSTVLMAFVIRAAHRARLHGLAGSERILLGWLVTSSAMLLLRAYEVQWADALHLYLFDSDPAEARLTTGLTPQLHLFGYHAAAAVPLAVHGFLSARGRKTIALSVAAIATCVAAMVLSGQRSAVLGSALGIAVVLYYTPGRRRMLATALLVVAAVVATGLEATKGAQLLQKVNTVGDEQMRASLQVRALEVIASRPFGVVITGERWEDLAGEMLTVGREITAHNAYLVHTMNFGWAAAAVMLGLIGWTLHYARAGIRQAQRARISTPLVGIVGAFAAVLLNACFHNASLFTFEPATTLCFLLIWSSRDAA